MLKRLSPQQRDRAALAVQVTALALAFFAVPIARYALEVERVAATASAEYSEEYAAEMAIDGKPETEWCLPDGALGSLDLVFSRSRRVDAVLITNGHNSHYMDRAIRKARIVLYDEEREIARHEVELPGIEPQHTPRRVTVKGRDVTRLRLEVVEFAGSGSALAEISVE